MQWPAYRLWYCITFPWAWKCDVQALERAAPLGPKVVWDILVKGDTSFEMFDGDFFLAWGARYTPMMRYEVRAVGTLGSYLVRSQDIEGIFIRTHT